MLRTISNFFRRPAPPQQPVAPAQGQQAAPVQNPPNPAPANQTGHHWGHTIKVLSLAGLEGLQLASTFLSLYLEDDGLVDSLEMRFSIAFTALTSLAFLVELGVNYMDIILGHKKLEATKDIYDNINTTLPNVATIRQTKWYKSYGLNMGDAQGILMHAVNTINSIVNLTSNACNIAIKLGQLNTACRAWVIAGNLISIAAQWLHQRGIAHNINHETELYNRATSHIVKAIINAHGNPAIPPNAAVIQVPQNLQTTTFTR